MHPRGGGRAAGPPRTRTLRRPVRTPHREPGDHAGRRHAPSGHHTEDAGHPRPHPAAGPVRARPDGGGAQGRLDPVIGRDAEIEQVLEVLARRTKNNPVLVGDPGVGKTAIVEGIAQRVADGEVPDPLKDGAWSRWTSRAWSPAPATAATSSNGSPASSTRSWRARAVDRAVRRRAARRGGRRCGRGRGDGRRAPCSSLPSPAASCSVIGATTLARVPQAHREGRRAGATLRAGPDRRAHASRTTITILRGLRERYEAHHDVRYHRRRAGAAAELSDRYLTDRFLPDKAIDLVDRRERTGPDAHAGAPTTDPRGRRARRAARAGPVTSPSTPRTSSAPPMLDPRDRRARRRLGSGATAGTVEITADDVAASSRARSPASRSPAAHRDRTHTGCSTWRQLLHRRVVGQDDAVEAVADAVRRRPGRARRTPTGRSGRSCSSAPPASARPSWPGRWPRPCSARPTRCCAST